jgi:uncharacterized membrane protein
MNIYEFHESPFVIPCFLWALYALNTNKKILFILTMIIGMGLHEVFPIMALSIGIYGAIFFKNMRKISIFVSIFCVIYFLYTMVSIPLFDAHYNYSTWISNPKSIWGVYIQGKNSNMRYYSNLGLKFTEIFWNLINKPDVTIKYMFERIETLKFLYYMGAPLAFLSYFSWEIFVMFPFLMTHLYGQAVGQNTILYHYSSPMIPFFFYAAIMTLKKIENINNKRMIYTILIVAIIVCGVPTSSIPRIAQNRTADMMSYWWAWRPDNRNAIREEALKYIPDDQNIGVMASFGFQAQLSNRHYIFSYHAFYGSLNTITVRGLTLGHITYIIIDRKDKGMKDFYDTTSEEVMKLILNNQFDKLFEKDDIAVYKKKIFKGRSIREASSGFAAIYNHT